MSPGSAADFSFVLSFPSFLFLLCSNQPPTPTLNWTVLQPRVLPAATMKSNLHQLLAFGLVVGSEATFLSWARDEVQWFPARETGSVEHSDSGYDPLPTSPAKQARDHGLARGQANGLAKRADDVCGYVSADPSESCPRPLGA